MTVIFERKATPVRPLVTKSMVYMGNVVGQENMGTRGYTVKKLNHFIDGYKQFPGESLLICYLELFTTPSAGVDSPALDTAEWKICFG